MCLHWYVTMWNYTFWFTRKCTTSFEICLWRNLLEKHFEVPVQTLINPRQQKKRFVPFIVSRQQGLRILGQVQTSADPLHCFWCHFHIISNAVNLEWVVNTRNKADSLKNTCHTCHTCPCYLFSQIVTLFLNLKLEYTTFYNNYCSSCKSNDLVHCRESKTQ